MSKEKNCKCCKMLWWDSCLKKDLCPNCYDFNKEQLTELKAKDEEIAMLHGENESLVTEIELRNKRMETIVYQLCDKIRKPIERKIKGQQFNSSVYCEGKEMAWREILDILDQIERGEL